MSYLSVSRGQGSGTANTTDNSTYRPQDVSLIADEVAPRA